MKLAVLFTGGKDSTYALYLAQKAGHQIVGLITLRSKNQASYMFHTPAIEITLLQAQALELPQIIKETPGQKEKELADLEDVLQHAKKKWEIEGVVTGALFSEYQSSRIENICSKLDLKVLSPLWHKPQEEEMKELLENKIQFIFTAVAAEGLDKSWLNKIITKKELQKLKLLQEKNGINLAGEGGEFESLVLDCPLFKKKIVLDQVEIKEESENTAHLIIKKVHLAQK